MTCQDLHNYFEGELHIVTDVPADAELAEHIATCRSCNRLVEGRKELTKHLHLLRDSAPPIPASLDSAVGANYRSFVLERSCLVKSSPVLRGINPRGALGWAAAVAFAVVVAYGGMLLFIPRQPIWVDRPGTARQPILPPAQKTENKATARAQNFTHKAPKSYRALVKRGDHGASLAELDNALPTRFRSLMYCDQMSCPGAMEVIRVQLPSPVLGLTPASARTNGVVSADVLVGPDGIARGIRVVE